jgi:hypothetical protein
MNKQFTFCGIQKQVQAAQKQPPNLGGMKWRRRLETITSTTFEPPISSRPKFTLPVGGMSPIFHAGFSRPKLHHVFQTCRRPWAAPTLTA